jgi:hypothetical protein
MHDHHRCICEHERVRFCRACRTVYCEDCKQEWVSRPLYSWPYIQYSGYSVSNIANGPARAEPLFGTHVRTAIDNIRAMCGHATSGAAGDQ